ncbi:hypothetical protein E2562_020969 [Oryza meyeriana var. granulata]|uniref:Uncharacterized protein n=1 Tax=Oryza meyeriana var. granulata TaxID=110450 RepID=A0A6G1DYD4_9ORYZ|nr:hypothetical protein E2562_020969 [Oryza meyeriana var. granulata]
MAAHGPNDFPVRSIDDILAVESAFGGKLPVSVRVIAVGLDRLDAAKEVHGALQHAINACGWVVDGMDELKEAMTMRKDLTMRKFQLKRILDHISSVNPSDLVSRARGRELLEARFGGPLPEPGHVITDEECRNLASLAERVSWDARLAHLRVTAVRWYLEALIDDVQTDLARKVTFSDE